MAVPTWNASAAVTAATIAKRNFTLSLPRVRVVREVPVGVRELRDSLATSCYSAIPAAGFENSNTITGRPSQLQAAAWRVPMSGPNRATDDPRASIVVSTHKECPAFKSVRQAADTAEYICLSSLGRCASPMVRPDF